MTETLSAWLAPVRDQLPSNFSQAESEKLCQAITQESLRRLDIFLSGIRFYQNFPAAREGDSGVETVWQQGTTRLLDYAPYSTGPVLFVVPSLVNRFEILDIDPDHSFLRFLAGAGFRPLVIDWQEPGDEEKAFSLSDYMTQRLVPALDYAQHLNKGAACHLLGYCMGGLLALALAAKKPQQIATLTLMATPWDFEPKGVGGVPAAHTMLGQAFLEQGRLWENYLMQVGYMPAELLQSVFTAFQSLSVLQKFMRFGSLTPDSEEARRFVLTEDWLNNGVPLALPVARECMHDWYDKNLTATLQWSVAGQLIDPRQIEVPTYVMVPTKDRIVPPESALPLAALIPNATLHQPVMGHIGLMTGDNAPAMVWQPFVEWLYKQ